MASRVAPPRLLGGFLPQRCHSWCGYTAPTIRIDDGRTCAAAGGQGREDDQHQHSLSKKTGDHLPSSSNTNSAHSPTHSSPAHRDQMAKQYHPVYPPDTPETMPRRAHSATPKSKGTIVLTNRRSHPGPRPQHRPWPTRPTTEGGHGSPTAAATGAAGRHSHDRSTAPTTHTPPTPDTRPTPPIIGPAAGLAAAEDHQRRHADDQHQQNDDTNEEAPPAELGCHIVGKRLVAQRDEHAPRGQHPAF